MASDKNKIIIIYDGECPFCSDFVSLNRLRDLGYSVSIINARDHGDPLVKDLSENYDLDDGMIVVYNDSVLFGAAAAHFISTSFAKRNIRAVFYCSLLSNQRIAEVFYPILVKLRKLFLRIIGKKRINDDN